MSSRRASRFAAVGLSAVLAVLALLALDDITTGSDPSHLLEWAVVAATAAWFGGLAWWRLAHRRPPPPCG